MLTYELNKCTILEIEKGASSKTSAETRPVGSSSALLVPFTERVPAPFGTVS